MSCCPWSSRILWMSIYNHYIIGIDDIHMLTCIEFWAVDCTYHRIQLPAWIKERREIRLQCHLFDGDKSGLTKSDKAGRLELFFFLLVSSYKPFHFETFRMKEKPLYHFWMVSSRQRKQAKCTSDLNNSDMSLNGRFSLSSHTVWSVEVSSLLP